MPTTIHPFLHTQPRCWSCNTIHGCYAVFSVNKAVNQQWSRQLSIVRYTVFLKQLFLPSYHHWWGCDAHKPFLLIILLHFMISYIFQIMFFQLFELKLKLKTTLSIPLGTLRYKQLVHREMQNHMNKFAKVCPIRKQMVCLCCLSPGAGRLVQPGNIIWIC